ncbi:MAG TPA: thiamine pyrophosphate-binding protein [Bryobacteraceae bacterium]|nr:thiamine pyrophosphate-binding protein [Bryobacteraceae bacterium]
MTNADLIVKELLDAGVDRLFGMPGGGSNADLIEAAGSAGLPFTLAHTETASAFMASAQAEITGKPGACLATLGPGAASLMNGVANAYLERIPLIVLTDCQSDATFGHQNLPQREMFAPLVKWTGRPRASEVGDALRCAIDASMRFPQGPVHLDLSSDVTGAAAEKAAAKNALHDCRASNDTADSLLQSARRPVFLLGLGARRPETARAIREACERFRIPALVTYKAKGVVPDRHPWFGGVLTNGTLEREILERADVFIAVGLDPVEMLPRAWKYPQPLIAIGEGRIEQKYFTVAHEMDGDIGLALRESVWDSDEIARIATGQRRRMRPAGDGLLPHRVAELTAEVYAGARITVDAGAHMFPIMSLWPAEEPCGVLISNALSSMGFALPAAIGAALLDRSKPVVAFTGDGGLLMCVAELRTAARENLRIRVIVFDDRDLTLIRMKQVQRGYRTDGVSMGEVDWCAVAGGLGVLAREAADEASLAAALSETAHHPGPVLIAARINPATYVEIMRALRG